jgi:hypothetical protein
MGARWIEVPLLGRRRRDGGIIGLVRHGLQHAHRER